MSESVGKTEGRSRERKTEDPFEATQRLRVSVFESRVRGSLYPLLGLCVDRATWLASGSFVTAMLDLGTEPGHKRDESET